MLFLKTAEKRKRSPKAPFRTVLRNLDRAGNFARTQATGAGVNTLGRTVYNGLNAFYVGFPHPVGVSLGVGHIVAENELLAADIALCHVCTSFIKSQRIDLR